MEPSLPRSPARLGSSSKDVTMDDGDGELKAHIQQRERRTDADEGEGGMNGGREGGETAAAAEGNCWLRVRLKTTDGRSGLHKKCTRSSLAPSLPRSPTHKLTAAASAPPPPSLLPLSPSPSSVLTATRGKRRDGLTGRPTHFLPQYRARERASSLPAWHVFPALRPRRRPSAAFLDCKKVSSLSRSHDGRSTRWRYKLSDYLLIIAHSAPPPPLLPPPSPRPRGRERGREGQSRKIAPTLHSLPLPLSPSLAVATALAAFLSAV